MTITMVGNDVEHNDALEFYNDFNNYTLNVKVPKNYLVWATGNLQNANEVLQSAYLERLHQIMKAGAIIHVAGAGSCSHKAKPRKHMDVCI